MNVRQTLGWNTTVVRVTKGLSQERLALESAINRSYVGRVERGSENVNVTTLEAFSNVLGVHVSAFFAPVEDGAMLPKELPAGRKHET